MTGMNTRLLAGCLVLLAFLGVAGVPAADAEKFRVTVTNLARGTGTGDECRVGQQMGLFVFATHRTAFPHPPVRI